MTSTEPASAMTRAVLVGLLLTMLAFVAGLLAVSWTSMPVSSLRWTDEIDAQDCSGSVSSGVQSCELLLIVHLLPSGGIHAEPTPADADIPPAAEQALDRLEAVRRHIETAIARLPGVAQVRTFGGEASVGDLSSTRSLLNEEPSLAIAVFRSKDVEAGTVAAAVRQVLARFGPSQDQDSAPRASDRLRWAIAYDTSRFVERSFAARLHARIEALWSGTEPASEPRYLVAVVQLPDGASLDRTEALLRRASAIAFTHPAVESAMAFAGLAADGSSGESNAGLVFLMLRPDAVRRNPEWSADAIATVLSDRLGRLDGADAAILSSGLSPGTAQGQVQVQVHGVVRMHPDGAGLASEGAPSLAAVFSSTRGPGREEEPSLLADVGLSGHRTPK